jgi:hypothetical protein
MGYLTKLNQQILIMSIVSSVILSQILSLLANDMFSGFYAKTLLDQFSIIIFYFIIVLIVAIILIQILTWVFKLKSSKRIR